MSVQAGGTRVPDMPTPSQAVAMKAPWTEPFARVLRDVRRRPARALRIAARVAVMVATLGLSALAGVRAAAASPTAPPAERVASR